MGYVLLLGFLYIASTIQGSLPWTHDQQNFIFSGTFWGALIIALPSMKIVQEGSPKIVLLVAMVIYVSSSVVTPFVANNWGVFPTWLARVSMGFGEVCSGFCCVRNAYSRE